MVRLTWSTAIDKDRCTPALWVERNRGCKQSYLAAARRHRTTPRMGFPPPGVAAGPRWLCAVAPRPHAIAGTLRLLNKVFESPCGAMHPSRSRLANRRVGEEGVHRVPQAMAIDAEAARMHD